ncbi:MAG: tetratricopeptide repeat protein [Acidobacteria bacterium]|nr:MAG: tetratricopeptide repeat protein [Acidobacteriota bacterium]
MDKKLPSLWLHVVMVVCATLPCFAAPQGPPPAGSGPLQQGIQLLSEGKYEQAVSVFNHCKQDSPLDPRPYFYSGMALTQAGELSPAAMELKEAVRLQPGDPVYRIFLANIYSRLKQKTHALAALTIFGQAGSLQPLATPWLNLLADVYFRLDQPDESLQVLNILGQRDPESARTNYELGRVYAYKNELDQAVQYYRKSIQESPVNPSAYFELGKTYYQKNDLPSAKQAFLQAVQQDRGNPEFLLKLGDTCLAMHENAEATKYLKLAEPSAASYPEIYYALGRAYQRQGDRANGDAYMKKFQEISTAESARKEVIVSVDRLIIRGQDAYDAGKTEEARTLFEEAARTDPHRWEAHGYLAEMYLASGDLERAYIHLAWMQKIYPQSVVGNYLMARYWVNKKGYRQALPYALNARHTMPDNSELRTLLARIYSHLGEKDKAEQESKEANLLAPDSHRAREDADQLKTPKPEVTSPQLSH